MKNQYYLNHSKIDVYFKQSVDDFVVTEVPLYEFSGEGEHLILTIRKKELSTWEMVEIISKATNCKIQDIGYAGLKDKNAMTVQNISMPKKYEESLKELNHPKIKILNSTCHNNKIKIGHLKGNKFFIRFKKVFPNDAFKIENILKDISKYGMANYFGFQRFGVEQNNYLLGLEILKGNKKERNPKLKQMYINAYQSFVFNKWLSNRIELSKYINYFSLADAMMLTKMDKDTIKELKSQEHPFKILKGELMGHYPFGKIFIAQDLKSEAEKFYIKDRVPTGLLVGKKVKLSEDMAANYEKEIMEFVPNIDGARRYAWVFVDELESNYKEDKKWFEMSFFLPKGSYATELIAEILH